MKRLRLVKLVVHPVFVIDDGDTLEEVTAAPVTVHPSDLPDFLVKFEADRLMTEAELNGAVAVPMDASSLADSES